MSCILNILNNTFIGTLLAGALITILGFSLYRRQKQIDITFDDLRKLRDNAAALYAAMEAASNKIEGLFNLYDGKNPQLTKPLRHLGYAIENDLVNKMGNGLVSYSNEITSLSEGLVSKIKIKNFSNIEIKEIIDNILVMNLYLNSASFILQGLKATEVEEWRRGWNNAKESINNQLGKILK